MDLTLLCMVMKILINYAVISIMLLKCECIFLKSFYYLVFWGEVCKTPYVLLITRNDMETEIQVRIV